MAEFYVHRQPSSENSHQVHDKDCTAISPAKDFMYLGSFATAQAAFKKASGFFDPISYCPACLSKHA